MILWQPIVCVYITGGIVWMYWIGY